MCNSAVYIDASPQRRDKFRRLQFKEIALYPAPYLFIVEGGEVDPVITQASSRQEAHGKVSLLIGSSVHPGQAFVSFV
jgi:hypothetical protein